ncbi:LON peptidase substrate-binding domain-containing protein [Microbacterium thalassium]|uniref:Lon protease-like protein n=1 Tax=Microbacterium thalassium TaxID=362649 RepID=A0A7X0FQ99_9MICO|nr:LON peptidase substrate-binding domain-containing protein [Microbacterium thalassium]MBB6391722.1 Lon protease-like protein [Microbacterium thalassium]GLK24325.1 hypothetical protein GCM10017607_16430 [Microbacterium thalassium]
MTAIAMFPLGTVLLPHMPLPLRIFESRYLVMLGRLLDDEHPEFGVVLIERGDEAGGHDQRFGIGTLARITRVIPRSDDVHLIAVGGRRFEVTRWLEDDPHPKGEVRFLPELDWTDDLDDLRADAERVVRRVLSRSAEFADTSWDPDIALSDDPVEASWQLAGIAPLGPIDQLRLLRSQTVRELLTTLIELTEAAEPTLTAADGETALDVEFERLLDGDEGDDSPGSPGDPDEPSSS